MNETKKVRSIARNINRSWVGSLFAVFLAFNVLTAGLAVCGWCYFQETASGASFSIETPRHFETISKKDIPKQHRNYVEKRRFFDSVPFYDALSRATYVYEGPGSRENSVYAGKFLVFSWRCLSFILLVQFLILLGEILTGSRKARRQLTPLYEVSQRAQELADAAAFDEDKFHDLENAISRISPTDQSGRLQTGDADLEGLERAVNSLLERMRQSYQQQARFVSDASHELRTPIAVIQGYANMLDRWGKEDEKVLAESIDAIKSESDHMKNLVEQLLFLARGDSGRNRLTITEFSLTETIREVLEESIMIDPDHTYRLKESQELQIRGDSAMLKQTARILVDNAAKYSPSGSEITLQVKKNEKGHICFVIQDEGIGIAPSDVPHVFERFFRADQARSRSSGGTGLGLSIARWIVDRHNGYFQVLSREDLGTRITVCLPQEPDLH